MSGLGNRLPSAFTECGVDQLFAPVMDGDVSFLKVRVFVRLGLGYCVDICDGSREN